MALKIRKSVPKELVFAKSDFLDLVNFGFLDFADFAAVDRFLIFSVASQPLAPPLILLLVLSSAS